MVVWPEQEGEKEMMYPCFSANRKPPTIQPDTSTFTAKGHLHEQSPINREQKILFNLNDLLYIKEK